MVEIERETDKREAQTTTLIIDSKTSQNADAAETKGYDVGKKTGIKLTAADVTDRDGAVRMITRFCDATDYLDFLKEVMTDRGYTGEKFAEAVKS
ncbi:MAG: IS5/IS1182 family transposase, partial [Oscillibacter sp.]|nr:IS5/IS1182 family transposase [Oscillibacter sp.]